MSVIFLDVKIDTLLYRDIIIILRINKGSDTQNICTMFQGKWKLQFIYELCIQSSMRFGELKKILKFITNTRFTNALKDLEINGLVH